MKGQKGDPGTTSPSSIQRPSGSSGLKGHKGGFGYRGTLILW